jgi:hypothetical protein
MEIDWNGSTPEAVAEPAYTPAIATPEQAPAPPRESKGVLSLAWDFRESFPEPTEQAVEAGIISPEDLTHEGIAAIHAEHAREMLATLHDLDAVLDARRLGVDPRNMKPPRLAEAKERLAKFFETEPPRLERWFDNLLGVYADAFGTDAAESFGKAVRAWHAGVEVVGDDTVTPRPLLPEAAPVPPVLAETIPSAPAKQRPSRERHSSRITARLPVPRPLPSAVAAGHFGSEENGKPVRPGTHEVREITETHAEKLVALIDQLRSAPAVDRDRLQGEYASGLAAYAEDFGEQAARQLEAYVTRQASLDAGSRRGR